LHRPGVDNSQGFAPSLNCCGVSESEHRVRYEPMALQRSVAFLSHSKEIFLPVEVQSYSLYVAGINAGSKQVDAAKALIAYLTSPAVKQALAANGFEPR